MAETPDPDPVGALVKAWRDFVAEDDDPRYSAYGDGFDTAMLRCADELDKARAADPLRTCDAFSRREVLAVVEEMLATAMAAGQYSVEGRHKGMARAAGEESQRVHAWAARLSALLSPAPQTEKE
jgi:hypothetical protein